MESDRALSIKTARIFAKVKPGGMWPFPEKLFTASRWEILPSLNLHPVRFPVNLDPQASEETLPSRCRFPKSPSLPIRLMPG